MNAWTAAPIALLALEALMKFLSFHWSPCVPTKNPAFPVTDWESMQSGAEAEVETDMDLKIEKEQPLISG